MDPESTRCHTSFSIRPEATRLYLSSGMETSASGKMPWVEIKLDKEQLRYWDVEKGQFVVPKGAFDVMVGASSKDIRLQTVIDL